MKPALNLPPSYLGLVGPLSAGLFECCPWLKHVFVRKAKGEILIFLHLPWWSIFTFGWLRRKTEARAKACLVRFLATETARRLILC